jgi:hypothetical protein
MSVHPIEFVRSRQPALRLVGVAALAWQIAACGGGGGTSAPVTLPQATVSVASIAPTQALIGTTVTVAGNGLAGVTTVRVGAGSVAPASTSGQQLTFVLPATATSAPVQVEGADFTATSSQTLQVSVPSLVSVTPQSAFVGSSVVITGTGLDAVQQIRFTGSQPVSFTRTGADTLSVSIPPSAVSGTIAMIGNGFSLESPVFIEITTPSVSSASGGLTQKLMAGSTFSVTGTNLDRVQSFVVNGVTLTVLSRSAGSVTLQAPGQRLAGTLMLVVDSYEVPTKVSVEVYLPMSASSLVPATGSSGVLVRLSGSGLAAATSVSFGAASSAVEAVSETEISVRVPPGAVSGAVRVSSPFQVVEGPVFTVLPAVRVTGFSVAIDGATVRLTVTGTALSRVTGASIGMSAATIVSQGDAMLVLEGPSNAVGAVVLAVANGEPVTAGAYSPTLTVTGIEIGQRFMRSSSDNRLRLIPGNAALLRVNMQSAAPATGSPPVTVTAQIGAESFGPLPLLGPATVPQAATPFDRSTGYSVRLPESWIRAGLALRVVVGGPAPSQIVLTPAVAPPSTLAIVMVPIVVNNVAPAMPSPATARSQLARVLPIAPASLTVGTRAAIAMPGMAPLSSAGWSKALRTLNDLRMAEAPDKLYYGVVAASVRADSISGLGYVNNIDPMTNGYMASVGFDASYLLTTTDTFGIGFNAWTNVMTHEVGHNLSRLHAPCGAVEGADPAFPYAGGTLADIALYDDASALLTGPFYGSSGQRMTDVMGYCNGNFFSDYNHDAVQEYLERYTAINASALVPAPVEGYLQLSGEISATGVSFSPAAVLPVPVTRQARGSHEVRIRTTAGATQSAFFTPAVIADAPQSSSHFVVAMTDPGEVASVEVFDGTRSLPIQNVGNLRAALAFRWNEDSGALTVRWNAEALPYLSAFHVDRDGSRRVLGINLNGPSATLDTTSLTPGGSFDLVFSDSVVARRMVVNRVN